MHDAKPSPFRAVAMTPQTPRILEGAAPTVAMNSLDEFTVRATGSQAERLEALYRTGSADLVHGAGGEMFEAVKMLRAANPQKYQPRERRRISAVAVRPAAAADRAADQGGRRTRDRVRRRRRLGHARQSGRRDGPARAASRRFRAIDRRARHRPRRPDGRRRDPDDVGVRPHGATRTETAARITVTPARCSSSAAT